MKIVQMDVDKLYTDPANARTHPEKNRAAIQSSLRRFGQQKPIVITKDGMVIAGNGTLEAAKSIGWKQIACVVTELESIERTAFGIADNRTSELAEWDTNALAEILAGLQNDEDFDHLATGFTDAEIQELIDESTGLDAEDVVEDEVPEPPVDPVTKPGDLWLLGEHRLLCGDSTKAEDVARLMDGAKINIAFTSPPYASQRKYDESSGFKPIPPDEYVAWWDSIQSSVATHIADDGSFFVNIKEHCEDGERHLYVKDLVVAHVRQWGWKFVDELCWTHGGTPKAVVNRFKNGWEPIFQFAKNTHKFNPKNVRHASGSIPDWGGKHPSQNDGQGLQKGSNADLQGSRSGGRAIHDAVLANTDGMAYPSNVLSVGKNREALGHGAAFPTGLPTFFIKAYTDESDNVYEPFCGSGTTLIAAEQLGRKCYGIEISPAYCDVIVKRWETLTGKTATLDKPYPAILE